MQISFTLAKRHALIAALQGLGSWISHLAPRNYDKTGQAVSCYGNPYYTATHVAFRTLPLLVELSCSSPTYLLFVLAVTASTV